ncbi:MAG: M60 family metallopeptidase [Dysgonamonadaceae bacterium]|jgi:hypothetical protein|nr:M60 family metallopeptidase [Dysgonamonadaceae bacterium]
MRKILFTVFLFSAVFVRAAITTPYPDTIELRQINSAEKERVRLCQNHKKYDKQPTGFYIAAGNKLELNVEIISTADNNVMPSVTVGTLGFNVEGRNTGTSTVLTEGVNVITNHSGGLVWLSFIQDAAAEPKGLAKITFTDNSEHVRVPRFVHGTTTDAEFAEMLTTYTTPDVLYQSDYVVVAATKSAANQFSKDNNKVYWLNSIHTLLAKEDEISGMDNNDANPVHHRLKTGEVRFLLVENTSASPHASSAGYTGYPNGSRSRYLTQLGTSSNNSWMLGHELGHQHQQGAYMISMATESTVNIYSYVVERYFSELNNPGTVFNRTTAALWSSARNTYLKMPFSKRIYDSGGDNNDFVTSIGFSGNKDELRFLPWEQLFLLFGDQFYKNLHRVVREEKIPNGSGTPDERRAYLIWKASQVSGYDLTEFFNIWGIRVSDADIKAKLRARIANALNTGAIVALPYSVEECVRVTGQNRPDWTPLTLRGITASFPDGAAEPVDRADWDITASLAGPVDATVAPLGDFPKYMIDGNNGTAFLFVKPGRSLGGVTTPADAELSFTVDMKTQKPFNYVSYMHRTGNTSTYIRARQISIYGSNDNADFAPVYEHYVIDHVKNANEITVEFPQASYRYIKVVIEAWDEDNGNTVQVAEFNAGIKAPEEQLPTPDPLKFKVNVVADDGIVTEQSGINLADEDSNYTVSFSLATGKKLANITVDGENAAPITVNNGYELTVNVKNHVDINITSEILTAIDQILNNNDEISIFPNPAKAGEPFFVNLNGDFKNASFAVYTSTGVKIIDRKVNQSLFEISVDKPGIYFLNTKKNGITKTAKIAVK